jgi:hypothetical protein
MSGACYRFFDDDECVDANWLQIIAREFQNLQTDFIARPCRPVWSVEAPPWIPQGYGGVLGIIDNGAHRARFHADFKGMLTQGNCAVRSSVFLESGPYPDQLKTGEDRWLYAWLLANCKAGYYCPDLVIHHLIHTARVTKIYFRDWAKREGRDLARCGRLAGSRNIMTMPWFWKRCVVDAAILMKMVLLASLQVAWRLRQISIYAKRVQDFVILDGWRNISIYLMQCLNYISLSII